MLQQLHIENFTIIDSLDLDFSSGLTVVTGETGAGKSIILDALGLVLGNRSDATVVPPNANKSIIIALFDIAQQPHVMQWLEDHDLEDENQCLLKRTLNKEGRSKAYINGQPVTLNMMKSLTQMLVDIHSQHAHHALLNDRHQLQLLDQFANHLPLLKEVNSLFEQYHQLQQRLQSLQSESSEKADRKKLLSYQLEELDNFALTDAEANQLNQEHSQLSHAQELQLMAQQHYNQLNGEEDVHSSTRENIQQALFDLSEKSNIDAALCPIVEQLQSIIIDLEAVTTDLRSYSESLKINPEKLTQLESRLSQWHDLARKHRIEPEQLVAHHQQLAAEFEQLSGNEEELEQLQQQLIKLKDDYFIKAQSLSQSRHQAALSLQKQVIEQLQKLHMIDCLFEVKFEESDSHPKKDGLEKIRFYFQPNVGIPPQPLSKIASGGELSRISLAIQVVTRAKSAIPVVIFDEVDVGIGGATAEIVGQLLKELSEQSQILCITHQPQVASQGMQHLLVKKEIHQDKTQTQIIPLNPQQRILEIARMLGGVEITQKTKNHAEEMLSL